MTPHTAPGSEALLGVADNLTALPVLLLADMLYDSVGKLMGSVPTASYEVSQLAVPTQCQ